MLIKVLQERNRSRRRKKVRKKVGTRKKKLHKIGVKFFFFWGGGWESDLEEFFYRRQEVGESCSLASQHYEQGTPTKRLVSKRQV
jgi:hypothetical protein